MSKSTNPSPALIATVSGAALIVVLVLIFAQAHSSQSNPTPSATPTVATRITVSPSPSPTPEVTGVASPTPSPSTSVNPSPSPTEGLVSLPESAKSFLANFYTSYKQQDRDRIGTLFTADTTTDLKSLHSTLFTGKDLQGNPGGPTLFSTNSAAEWVTDYTLLGAAPQGTSWTVTVREKRASANSTDTGTITTLVTLAPAPNGQGTWLINSYVHAGSTDKYNGFFIQ